MDEEKMRILKMLEEGKITAQEAISLLEALASAERKEKETQAEEHYKHKPHKMFKYTWGWNDTEPFTTVKHVMKEVNPAKIVAVVMKEVNPGKIVSEVMREVKRGMSRWNFDFPHDFVKHKQSQQLSIPAQDINEIVIANIRGNINVIGTDGTDILIEADKTAWAPTDEEAKERAKEIEIITDQKGDKLSIRAHEPKSLKRKRHRIDFDIKLPSRLALNIVTIKGDISVSMMKSNLHLKATSGDLKTKNITGELELASTNGEIEVHQIDGQLKASTMNGNIKLSDSKGKFMISSMSGDSQLHRVEGEMSSTSLSGDIHISESTGEIEVTTKSGDLKAENCQGTLECDTTSGDVELKNIQVNSLTAKSTSGDITAEFKLIPPEGQVKFSTISGDIVATVSPETNAEIEIRTISGDINCDLPLTSVEKTHRRLKGVLNSPQGRIILETTSGDLRLSS